MHPPHRAGQRRPVLGIFTDWLKGEYQNDIVVSVARACAAQDVNLLCFAGGQLDGGGESRGTSRNVLFEFGGQCDLDALIVMGGNVGGIVGSERLREYLEQCQVPRYVSMAYRISGTPSVLVDNQAGLQQAVEHLIVEHRCRNIAFLRGPVENQEAEERFLAYRRVLVEHGLRFDERLTAVGDFMRPSGQQGMREILERRLPLDAVVAANDFMALGALDVLLTQGLRVPGDVALVGFDDVDEARLALPQLTTVRQPFGVLGRAAVRTAMALIRGEPVADETTVPTQLVTRRSCGCGAMTWDEGTEIATSLAPTASQDEIRARFVYSFAALESEGIAVSETVALALFDSLCDELHNGVSGRFARMLADLIRATTTESMGPWNRVTAVIFSLMHTWTEADIERRHRFDAVARQVRESIGDVAELTQGMARVRLKRLALNLSDISKALTGAASFDGIRSALDAHLPSLDIPACFLSLYIDFSSPQSGARLVWAHDRTNPSVRHTVGRKLPPRELVPSGLNFQGERTTFVLEPLYFAGEQLGTLAIQMGPVEGVVYEALRDQVSGAIHSVLLVERMLEEVKKRNALEREQTDKEI